MFYYLNIFKSNIKDDVIAVICILYSFLLDLKLFEKEIFQIRPILSLTLNNGSGVYFFASCARLTDTMEQNIF